jgi:hypothetical protein
MKERYNANFPKIATISEKIIILMISLIKLPDPFAKI